VETSLQKLADCGINLLPAMELTTHFVFERDGFISLVDRREAGFGNIGAPGLLFEKGMAQLIWRGGKAFFVAKGFEREASDEEVAGLRRFASDLKNSLAG
jgi:hypothetical protein